MKNRLLLGFLLLNAPAFGAILISDDFDLPLDTAINGTAPGITVNGATWAANPAYTSNGSAVRTTGTSGKEAGIDLGFGYFNSHPGVYNLGADIFFAANASPGTTWYGIGFTEANTTGGSSSYATTSTFGGSPFIILRENGQVGVYSGPGATSAGLLNTSSAGDFPNGSAYALELVLDTSVLNWTLDAYVNSTQLDLNGAGAGNTFVFGTNPTIQFVGFSSSTGLITATLDNFQLSVSPIPEPKAWALALAAILGLCLRFRRSLFARV